MSGAYVPMTAAQARRLVDLVVAVADTDVSELDQLKQLMRDIDTDLGRMFDDELRLNGRSYEAGMEAFGRMSVASYEEGYHDGYGHGWDDHESGEKTKRPEERMTRG